MPSARSRAGKPKRRRPAARREPARRNSAATKTEELIGRHRRSVMTQRHPDDSSATAVDGFLPDKPARRPFESVVARLIATAGVVAIGTAAGAIAIAVGSVGWVAGLIVSCVTTVLAAILWRSRHL